MIHTNKCTKEQVNLVLDAMKPGDEIEIKPVTYWRNSRAIKENGMFIVTTRDVYTMEMMKSALKTK